MPEAAYLVSAVALTVSLVFGLANHIQHVALQHMDVRSGTMIIVGVGLSLLLILSPAYLDLTTLSFRAVFWFALGGLIVPALSMTLHTKSIGQLGPAITSALTSTSPLFAITIALIFLNEDGGIRLYTGTAIIIGGIIYIALRSRQIKATWPLWALLFPLGAAFCRASSYNVIKIGLADLPNPLTAALVGSTVSLIVLSAIQIIGRHPMPRWNPGYGWFALCGVLNGIGLIGLNIALHLGTVTLVSPLVATTPAFTLILGWLYFRKETVGWQTVVAMAVIFVGCLLIIFR
ncbi:MAG: DMT family transporter [Burkholderiaceae bacterium]